MKSMNLLFFFILTWSCSFAQQNILENDSNIVAIDSVSINHKIYKAIFTLNETSHIPYSTLYILNSNGLIIFQDSTNNDFANSKFIDFNGDGYKDLLISYVTNVPGIQDLILFDPQNNKFRKVTDFTEFPASQKIKGTNYYYSYHRSGCADMYWDSDLYELKNNQIKKMGHIAGRACNDPELKDGIYIFTVLDKKEKKISFYPIETLNNYKNGKWGFIKSYWTKNHNKFRN
jgi:hypothetical protein